MKPNFTDINVSKTLRALRVYKGEKLITIANFLNMSECNYSKYESGKIAITIGLLKRICDYYCINMNEIIKISESHLSDNSPSEFFSHNNLSFIL